MLIAFVALAGLLSFGPANIYKGASINGPVQEERVVSHTIGNVETVKQDQPKQERPVQFTTTVESNN